MDNLLLIRLWRLLHRVPVASPLTRYARLYSRPAQPPTPNRTLSHIVTTVIALLLLPIAAFVVVPMVVRLYANALGYLVLILPALYTAYGASLAALIVNSLNREIAKQTYDVLCATPLGRFGVHRFFAAHEVGLSNIYRMLLYLMIGLAVIALWAGAGDDVIFDGAAPTLINAALRALVLSLFFVLDYAYSLAFSGLIAMLLPALLREITLLWTVSAYLSLQGAVYAAALVAGDTLRRVYMGLFDPALADGLLAISALAFYLILRELILLALWRMTTRELNAPELDSASRAAL